MKNPKILITESGPCVFDAPVEPNATLLHTPIEEYQIIWKAYEQALSESKKPENRIYFKDEEHAVKIIFDEPIERWKSNLSNNVGFECGLPKGYDLLFEGSNSCKYSKCDCATYTECFDKVAILKKQDSAHGFTEGSRVGVDEPQPGEPVFVTNKVAEIAQWVIDNRYPKDDRYKISDWEMYQHICESIEALVNK